MLVLPVSPQSEGVQQGCDFRLYKLHPIFICLEVFLNISLVLAGKTMDQRAHFTQIVFHESVSSLYLLGCEWAKPAPAASETGETQANMEGRVFSQGTQPGSINC